MSVLLLLVGSLCSASHVGHVTAAGGAAPKDSSGAMGIAVDEVTVNIDWEESLAQTATAATIEVDVMPFLGRTTYGGPFNSYYEALSNLGSEYVRWDSHFLSHGSAPCMVCNDHRSPAITFLQVRYAPWFPNPRVVVTELTPPDCTETKPATNWNSTLFDGIMSDFMSAVW